MLSNVVFILKVILLLRDIDHIVCFSFVLNSYINQCATFNLVFTQVLTTVIILNVSYNYQYFLQIVFIFL